MIFTIFEDFSANTSPLPHRMLGLDVGNKTLGLAVGNTQCSLASPLKTLTYSKVETLIDQLRVVIQEYMIKSLVIGYPLNMDGTEGER
jgi:putative holliday junction resolvase